MSKFHLVYKRKDSPYWWARGGPQGRYFRESTKTTDYQEARAYQRRRVAEVEAEIERQAYVPRPGDYLLSDVAQLIRRDYKNEGFRSTERLGASLKQLTAHFGNVPVIHIPAKVGDYIDARHAEGAKDSTIRLELSALKRAMRLAELFDVARKVKVPKKPKNARRGFVTAEELKVLLLRLPEHLRPLAEFGYMTGWRRREMTELKWGAVDRGAKEIRLHATETKNEEPRVIHYGSHAGLVAIMEGQWSKAEALLREQGKFPEYVFTRPGGGPLINFYTAWRTACKEAGKPGLLLHDLRRSAARAMMQAGIPQPVIMQIGGWKTDSMFRRYAIVSPDLIRDALGRMGEKES